MVKLPDIEFCHTDPERILSEMVKSVETSLQRTLQPGDPIRLLLQSMVPIFLQQRYLINKTGKGNLVAYAKGLELDHLAISRTIFRRPAKSAKTVLRFAATIPDTALTIPRGTQVYPAGSTLRFKTLRYTYKSKNADHVDVEAECSQLGPIGNGYLPGQITQVVTPIAHLTVTNIDESSGGAEIETDEELRTRIVEAPEGYSVAGPEGAYRYWAKRVNPNIIDASVRTTAPGVVEIRPLLKEGILPDEGLLNNTKEALRSMAPITDTIIALTPEVVGYDLNVEYYLLETDNALAEQRADTIKLAYDEYVVWQRHALGRDINPSKLIGALQNAGAHRVVVHSPSWKKLETHQLAVEQSTELVFGGFEHG